MSDLIEVVGLRSILEKHGLASETMDFEALYSFLFSSSEHDRLLYTLDNIVFKYFAQLELPENPTLYDHMVLCLRHKDLIATFNWDPLLPQAMSRVAKRFGDDILPQTLYLHGNVAIGYCGNHALPTVGFLGNRCGKCGAWLSRSETLFPVMKKNYTDDPFISRSWTHLKAYLSHAFILTIFGYRAPQSDVEAVSLVKEAWGRGASRELEQIEIVDIRDPQELYKSWEPMICGEHYGIKDDFYQSLAAQHPRRSCEDFWQAIMQCDPQEERPIPRNTSWDELEEWAVSLLEQERMHASREKADSRDGSAG